MAGLSDYLEVLQAQQQRIPAESSLALARAGLEGQVAATARPR